MLVIKIMECTCTGQDQILLVLSTMRQKCNKNGLGKFDSMKRAKRHLTLSYLASVEMTILITDSNYQADKTVIRTVYSNLLYSMCDMLLGRHNLNSEKEMYLMKQR